MEAFQRDGLGQNFLDALLIFSQLGLQIPLTVLVSGEFKANMKPHC